MAAERGFVVIPSSSNTIGDFFCGTVLNPTTGSNTQAPVTCKTQIESYKLKTTFMPLKNELHTLIAEEILPVFFLFECFRMFCVQMSPYDAFSVGQ